MIKLFMCLEHPLTNEIIPATNGKAKHATMKYVTNRNAISTNKGIGTKAIVPVILTKITIIQPIIVKAFIENLFPLMIKTTPPTARKDATNINNAIRVGPVMFIIIVN